MSHSGLASIGASFIKVWLSELGSVWGVSDCLRVRGSKRDSVLILALDFWNTFLICMQIEFSDASSLSLQLKLKVSWEWAWQNCPDWPERRNHKLLSLSLKVLGFSVYCGEPIIYVHIYMFLLVSPTFYCSWISFPCKR